MTAPKPAVQPDAVDPVCGMTVDPATAVGHLEHEGQTYYFCSRSCLERFRATPEAFLKPAAPIAPCSWYPGTDAVDVHVDPGATVSAVARQLGLSEGTVRNHLSGAIGKTGAATRAEAARIAQDNGWL